MHSVFTSNMLIRAELARAVRKKGSQGQRVGVPSLDAESPRRGPSDPFDVPRGAGTSGGAAQACPGGG